MDYRNAKMKLLDEYSGKKNHVLYVTNGQTFLENLNLENFVR